MPKVYLCKLHYFYNRSLVWHILIISEVNLKVALFLYARNPSDDGSEMTTGPRKGTVIFVFVVELEIELKVL